MPRLTRYFIKTALIYLVASLLIGALVLARAAFDLPSELAAALAALTPVYFHLFMVGWVTQLIFGMLFWMLPRQSKERPRGNESLAWIAFITINVGLLMRAIGEPLVTLQPDLGAGWLLAFSAVLQLIGGWAFIGNAWPRVRER
jgi:heme/copper-type cytochrome/quinol oxidase subunit 1